MGLIVKDPGFFTTVQDMGRPGFREWGVPLGGAFDRESADLANALLGNPPTCAVLELTLRGGMYQAGCPLALALAGASIEGKVVSPSGAERPLRIPSSFSIEEREQIVLGRTLAGARTYLAVMGGWETPVRLGSRSSERCVRAGEVLAAGPGTIPTRYPSDLVCVSPSAETFRIIDGPDAGRDSGFDDAFWADRRFRVGSQSNRMGLRLEGAPLKAAGAADRLSAPVAPGAVQVAGGCLIVLGVACGTMGGYPHIAHVISPDLDRLGQLRPGDFLGFRRVTLEEARLLDREARMRRKTRTSRIALIARDGGFSA
jgi:5-oxoprolinase (ATP-hydrolysing) subunit C